MDLNTLFTSTWKEVCGRSERMIEPAYGQQVQVRAGGSGKGNVIDNETEIIRKDFQGLEGQMHVEVETIGLPRVH